jgi:general secretion pathway protein F
MGAFEYTALDTGGRERKGVLEGDTPRHIRQLLRERQLLPVTVNEVAQKESKRQQSTGMSLSFSRRGIATADLSLFTRQLATLVRAGLPLEESLLAVSQQTEKPRVQSIVLGVRAKVMEGHPLADGLADFPRVFPEIYRSTVAAGEQSGKLDGVLERLADYTEGREQIRQKILAAMLYPIVLSVMCFAIVTGLMVYVVPKVVAVFESAKGKLPMITQILIATSDFLRNYGIYMVIVAGLGAYLFRRWLRNPNNLRRWHRAQLRMPMVGKLSRGFNTARFTRTFSILSASSVPVLEALRISVKAPRSAAHWR